MEGMTQLYPRRFVLSYCCWDDLLSPGLFNALYSPR